MDEPHVLPGHSVNQASDRASQRWRRRVCEQHNRVSRSYQPKRPRGYSTLFAIANDGALIGAVIVGTTEWPATWSRASRSRVRRRPRRRRRNADKVNSGDTHDTFIGLGSVFNWIDRVVIGGLAVGTAAADELLPTTSKATIGSTSRSRSVKCCLTEGPDEAEYQPGAPPSRYFRRRLLWGAARKGG